MPTKVERYDFSMSQTFDFTVAGPTPFDPSQIEPAAVGDDPAAARVLNSPQPGVFTLTAIQVANVNAMVGGQTDAFIYGPQSQGVHLDLPTLTPANRLTVSGSWTGFAPTEYTTVTNFPFCATFQGPATVVA